MGFGIPLKLADLRLKISCKLLGLLKGIALPIILIISIVLNLSTSACAEEISSQFDQIRVEHGLSQSCVLAILQDSKGLMWFGTQDGLNKYDGYNLTVYKYNELDSHSLSDNFILSLYEDKSGTIWVGTHSGGLNEFDRETERFTHYTNDPDNPTSLGSNTVWSIYEDKLGTLWIGTAGGGLNHFNRKTEQFTHYTHNPNELDTLSNNTVLSIYEDKFGTLWIGTAGGGLNQFNRETEQFTHYTHNADDSNSLSNNTILSIYEDQAGKLWIGTNGGGFNKFDRDTGEFTHYLHDPDNPNSLSDNNVNSIVEDRFGNLWLATSSWYGNSYGTALNKFNPETEQFTHYIHDLANPNSLSENTVASILRDKSDILWIGTGFSGINKLDTKYRKFIHYKHDPADTHSLVDNHISSIYEDRSGTLWIGTYDRGLDKFDPKTEQFIHYRYEPNNPNSLSSDKIWSVYEDKSGILWIGTGGGGLNKFEWETGKFTHYLHNPAISDSLSDNNVWSISEDQTGVLWIGTFNGGLNKFDRKTGKFTHYTHNPDNANNLSDNNIFSIYEDQLGTLWIGTFNGGLNKFNRETGEFTQYKHDPNNLNSLSYDRVLSMYEYPAGTLWIGTYGGGLDKFDISTETFTHYTEKDGLPNNSVVGILADDQGNLWLSTGKGLSKFNPKTETFRNYDVSDGLQGNEFDGVKAYFKSKTGEMFFGGLNGFNAFYPEQVKDNPHIPPIVITDFRIFDKTVKLGTAISETKELKLSYKDNFFGFEFAALDYTNPQKNQYAYKLEGFDKDWIYSGSRRYATYTNLDGGTYIFRAKGSNNDGVWNEEGTSIKIIITPPPWKTWWAYTLYLIALVSAIYGYVQWKTRAQAKENALLRENERRLHQFLEAIPLGINVIDTTGKVVYFNQAALKIYGRESSSDSSIKNCLEVYPQLYIAGTKQPYPLEDLPLMRALRGEKRIVDDLEIHQSDKIIPVEVWGTPIYDEQGTILYATVAFQDITHRKQAETERQEYIEALRVSLREKEVLLKEVHHRVKNNLQIICSLLDLQSQNLTDQKTLDVFRNSYNRVKSMAIIHEKLYQSTSLEKIDFVDYVETLTYYLFQSYSTSSDFIKININIEPISLNLDTAIPCGLIINELLSNALKHAFPQLNEGCIELNFKSDTSQKFILIVKDNGIGFANDFDIQKNSNLGLQLVKLLTQQLEGDLEFNQSQGSEFKIKFEVKA
jgi:PAS domain S-box-containing protein